MVKASDNRKPLKPLNQLKSLHNEHYGKLQSKHALETDLLDDLRSFCKQRAAIEREYGQSLQKLVSNFSTKKDLQPIPTTDENSPTGQTVWQIWRSLLDESNNIALSRLRASDTQQRLYNELKPLKSQRLAVNKRVFEQLRTLQSDLAACVQEMVKSHKVYAEEEKQAQETRFKTMAAKEKIQRRSTDIFHSMAQLHRNYEKLLTKRQAFDMRSATARNEYLFQLTAINAHLKHYFTSDLPSLVKTLDGELYEKLAEVFTALCQHEIEMCSVTQKRFERLLTDSSRVTRTCAWEQFLKSSPLFDKTVQYQFEPLKGDENSLLCSFNGKENNLEQIGRKLARRLVIRERRIKSHQNELKMLQAGYVATNLNEQQTTQSPESENNEELLAFNQEYVEHKLEELQFAIRREEIERVKIEACLSLLRNSSVEVTEFIVEARAAAEAAAAAQLRNDNPSSNLLDDPLVGTRSGMRPSDEGGSMDSAGSSSGASRFAEREARLGYWDRSLDPYSPETYTSPRRPEESYHPNDGKLSYRNDTSKWSATCPRPTTITQNSSTQNGSEMNNTRFTSWTMSRGMRGHMQHDYQNVDASQPNRLRTHDDIAVHQHHHNRTSNSLRHRDTNSPIRVASSGNLVCGDDVDLEALWSENGRLRRAAVTHEFRAKRPDELDLVVHETVVLLEPNSHEGWIKVRSLIDGNEGLVPMNYLKIQLDHSSSSNDTCPANSQSSSNPGSETHRYLTPTNTNGSADSKQKHDKHPHSGSRNSTSEHSRNHLLGVDVPPDAEAPRLTLINDKVTKPAPLPGTFVRTLLDFHGSNPDELTFGPGSVIRVLGRAPLINHEEGHDEVNNNDTNIPSLQSCSPTINKTSSDWEPLTTSGIDDGWWEGELLIPVKTQGTSDSGYYVRRKGVFPSMLTQIMPLNDTEIWSTIWYKSLVVPDEEHSTLDKTRPTPSCDFKSTNYSESQPLTVKSSSHVQHQAHHHQKRDLSGPKDTKNHLPPALNVKHSPSAKDSRHLSEEAGDYIQLSPEQIRLKSTQHKTHNSTHSASLDQTMTTVATAGNSSRPVIHEEIQIADV